MSNLSSAQIIASLEANGETLGSISTRTRIPAGTLSAIKFGQSGTIPASLKSAGNRANIKKLLAVDLGLSTGVNK